MFEAITEYKTRADRKLMQKIQAILFVSEGAVSIDDLCQSLGEDYEDIEMSLADLDDYLCEENSALEIREVADGFQLFTKDEYYEACESYILDQDRRKLSGSAIEVLSIVAYTQPVTRSQISEIRGVNSDPLVTTLINKGYVFESGVSADAGNPALLSTTTQFLNSFGFTSIDEIPPIEDFAPDEDARISIAERLGALHSRNVSSGDDEFLAVEKNSVASGENASMSNGDDECLSSASLAVSNGDDE